MKLKTTTVCLAAAALFAVNCKPKPAANAPTTAAKVVKWDCKFNGNYVESDGDKGTFTWNVIWNEMETTSTITGGGKDAGGESTTNGNCDKNACKIQEEYISGNQKGKKNFWAFTYQDAETKNDAVYVTTLSGTYGPSDADRTSSGKLTAKADCKAVP